MSVSKATKWGNTDIVKTIAHKKYILSKAERQYWFNLRPANFKQEWTNLLISSMTYKRSKRKDYRFVFSVSKVFVKKPQKFFACCIQFQKKYFSDWCGLFAVHETGNSYHVHFLLNPVNIFTTNRKFHKISPQDYDAIKKGWEDYLKIFNLYDGKSYCKYKQLKWNEYYKTRYSQKFKQGNRNNKNYNLKKWDAFIDIFLNPMLIYLNNHTDNKFRLLKKQKYYKNSRFFYYQTKDITNKINEIKKKWDEIKWTLAIRNLNTDVVSIFEQLLSCVQNKRLTKSFPAIYNQFDNKKLSYLFQEVHNLSDDYSYMKEVIELRKNYNYER